MFDLAGKQALGAACGHRNCASGSVQGTASVFKRKTRSRQPSQQFCFLFDTAQLDVAISVFFEGMQLGGFPYSADSVFSLPVQVIKIFNNWKEVQSSPRNRDCLGKLFPVSASLWRYNKQAA